MSLNRPAVLVADPSPTTRRDVIDAITAHEPAFTILEAETGRGALALLQEHAPDLVFASLHLPDFSGAKAIANIAAQGQHPFSILLSNQVVPDWAELAEEVNAYEFIRLPFAPHNIPHILTNYLRARTPLRLLLVDDSAVTRQLVSRLLKTCRFRLDIDETDSGKHALKLMRLQHYDLALLDYTLGAGINGLEVAVHAREVSPDTKIILVSASDDPSLSQASRLFGGVGFVKKPFFRRDIDLAFHRAFDLHVPYLLKALTSAPRRGCGRAAADRVGAGRAGAAVTL
jgi:CheY-like chemotaxis protein